MRPPVRSPLHRSVPPPATLVRSCRRLPAKRAAGISFTRSLVSFVHAPSLADFITTMVGFKLFGTHRCITRNSFLTLVF
jgi:hypothetical protein